MTKKLKENLREQLFQHNKEKMDNKPFTDKEYIYEIIQVQVNRSDQIGPDDMAKALNPIFILTAVKK